MRPYQLVALALVLVVVAFIAGLKVGAGKKVPLSGPAEIGPSDSGGLEGEVCCSPLPAGAGSNVGAPPKAPTGSGLPCFLEFGANECEACQLMEGVLRRVADKLAGKVDVVVIDTDVYPEEATRWRLRMIPTQIVLDAAGEELWRHEGYLSDEDLLTKLGDLGIELD